MFLGSHTNQT